MIYTKGLTKKFKKKGGELIAVDHINLEIKKGEIYGLIGPNGAGKTTTIKMLAGLILPDEGTATIDGLDIVEDADEIGERIGALAGEFTRRLYWRLTGQENLRFFAKLRNIWHPEDRVDELLNLFDLEGWADELFMRYSTGMKHKLALAVALINDPPVLFLDEPLTGIDPATNYQLKKLIRNRFKDKTIIWTSHNLYEIEEMCDRVGLINKGKIVLEGSPEELKKGHWDYEILSLSSPTPEMFKTLKEVEIKGNRVEIKTRNLRETLSKVMGIVEEDDVEIEDIRTLRPTLEEIFMRGVNAK